jgi:toxin ParE1/3/4
MVKIEFTEQAISDIKEIATYIGFDSIHFASLQVTKIFTKTEILENYPFIGRVVPELNIKSVREIFEGNYRVIYRIVNKELVHIVTVYHSRRLLKRSDLKRIIGK